jgi:hypothetical protein
MLPAESVFNLPLLQCTNSNETFGAFLRDSIRKSKKKKKKKKKNAFSDTGAIMDKAHLDSAGCRSGSCLNATNDTDGIWIEFLSFKGLYLTVQT